MFTNFIEESYLIVNLCEHTRQSAWEEEIDEVSTFLYQLKQLRSKLSSEVLTNNSHINILHPKAISQIDILNGKSITQATQRYYTPEKIDLLPYLIKYYYKFFLERDQTKVSNKSSHYYQNLPLQRGLSPIHPIKSKESAPNDTTSSNKETLSMNLRIQTFPLLNRTRLIDLKGIFLEEPTASKGNSTPPRPNTAKLPIFSKPKPIYRPRESQNEIIKLMDSQSDSLNMPLVEPPSNNPTTLLRKSNYFLYYQMIKRNEAMSFDARKVSEYEFNLSSPEKLALRRSYTAYPQLVGSRVESNDDSASKISVNDSTNIPPDRGFAVQTTSFFNKKPEPPKNLEATLRFNTIEQSPLKTEGNIGHGLSPYFLTNRSATDKGPQTKKIMDEVRNKFGAHKRNEPLHSVLKTNEADKFFGGDGKKNSRVVERRGDSPVESPIFRTNEGSAFIKERQKLKANSAKKLIFELKGPVKVEKTSAIKGDSLVKLNRSASANEDYSKKKVNTHRPEDISVVQNKKVCISKGDLDPSPPISPNKQRSRIFEKGGILPIRAFSVEDDVEDRELEWRNGSDGDVEYNENIEEEEEDEPWMDIKEEKVENERGRTKEARSKEVMIKNLDTVRWL